MTDLATPPATGDDVTPARAAEIDAATPEVTAATVEWAPPAPPRRNSVRRSLLIGGPVAAVLAAGWFFGTTLIAPGMVVGNVPVGGLTVDAAAEKISAAIAETPLALTVDGASAVVTGAELGAHFDVRPLAARALVSNPLWSIGSWFPEHGASLRPVLDPEIAAGTLRAAFPDVYEAPIDADLTYAADTASFIAVDGTEGRGLSQRDVQAALVAALNDEVPAESVEVTPVALAPAIPTLAAHNRAAVLNGMLDTIGFYVGGERVAPIDRATAASWITLNADPDAGIIRFAVDGAALPELVQALPEQVNRAAVDTQQVVNSAGDVLRVVLEGTAGRELVSTDGIAEAFTAQLNSGAANFQLDVTETPFGVATLHRRIEVNVSSQRTFLFENDEVVRSWSVSTGLPGHDTDLGNYKIYAHVRIQDMGSEAAGYLTKDVPWVSYFNQDEAFHGAYWHNNFGQRMSHGCVNMRLPDAKFIYDWAPIGTEVWVRR